MSEEMRIRIIQRPNGTYKIERFPRYIGLSFPSWEAAIRQLMEDGEYPWQERVLSIVRCQLGPGYEGSPIKLSASTGFVPAAPQEPDYAALDARYVLRSEIGVTVAKHPHTHPLVAQEPQGAPIPKATQKGNGKWVVPGSGFEFESEGGALNWMAMALHLQKLEKEAKAEFDEHNSPLNNPATVKTGPLFDLSLAEAAIDRESEAVKAILRATTGLATDAFNRVLKVAATHFQPPSSKEKPS